MGDHILAHRFAAAIKEKHPESNLHLYSDTEGNSHQSDFLQSLYPGFYKTIEVVPNRVNKEFEINHQFGPEKYPAELANLPEEYISKFRAADKFYDLHIDSLKWMNYDFDWRRYFYFFPKPVSFNSGKVLPKKFALLHLYARPDSSYNLDQWYIERLVEKLSKFIDIIIITQGEHKNVYNSLKSIPNVSFCTGDLKECASLAENCSIFIGIDSGIKYLPILYSKPFLIFSKDCTDYYNHKPSHLFRWLLFKDNIIPNHYNLSRVSEIVENLYSHPACSIFPFVSYKEIDNYIVNRKFDKLRLSNESIIS